jgi:hypothetical protein
MNAKGRADMLRRIAADPSMSRRLRLRAVPSRALGLVFVATVLFLLWGAGSALAVKTHLLLSQTEVPGQEHEGSGIAYGDANGHLYVVNSISRVIYNFGPNGKLDPTTPQLTGAAGLEPFAVAVDNSGGTSNGTIWVGLVSEEAAQFSAAGAATGLKLTVASVPANGTAQGGGLPPVVNNGRFVPRAIAVDAAGNVYVGDIGGAASSIDKFSATGEFIAQLGAGLIGSIDGLAVDVSGHIWVAAAGSTEAGLGVGLYELTETGQCVEIACTPTDTQATLGVSADRSQGTIFTTVIDTFENGGSGHVNEYDEAGNLLGMSGASALRTPGAIAVSEPGGNVFVSDRAAKSIDTFGPVTILPDATTEAAMPVGSSTATFHGQVGAAGGPSATCLFQYVGEAEFQEEGFTQAQSVPCSTGPFSGEGLNPVTATVTELNGGTTYHYRVLATSANGSTPGEDITFITPGPTVGGTEAVGISEGAATLKATVNPNGAPATTYLFQYLTQAAFEAVGWIGATEVPGGMIGLSASGSGDLAAGKSAAAVADLNTASSAVGSGDLSEGSKEITALNIEEGTIEKGEPITGNGIPAGTTIVAIGSGTLELSAAANASETAVDLAAGSRVVTALNIEEGVFEVGMLIAGNGIPAGTTITAFGPGSLVLSTPAQASGTGVVLAAGSRVVKSLNIDEGEFRVGQTIVGPGIPPHTMIVGVTGGGTVLMLSANAGQTLAGAALSATEPLVAEQTISGLAPGTGYRFRVVATDSTGAKGAGPNSSFRTFSPAHPNLPDGRAYEQVSPVDKNGNDVQVEANAVQAAPDGDAVTFFSNSGLPGASGGQNFGVYQANRAPDDSGWTTEGLFPAASAGPLAQILGWSENLTETYASAKRVSEPSTLYQRARGGTLTPITTESVGTFPNNIAASSATGSVVYFESRPTEASKPKAYLWDRETGTVVLADVMNNGSGPSKGAFSGPYDWFINHSTEEASGAKRSYYTQASHVLSSDGSRAFFTEVGTGQLYVRENPFAEQSPVNGEICTEPTVKACTVRVSAPAEGMPDPETPAAFVGASADGSAVYFLDQGKLTADATATTERFELYRYQVESGDLTDLTVDPGSPFGADVQGIVGTIGDGSYIYFVANGVLAPGATQGSCSPQSIKGQCNLYVSHNGAVTFIAMLDASVSSETRELSDERDWTPTVLLGDNALYGSTSRTSADGRTLLFRSSRRLTSYQNEGVPELYLFHPGSSLLCVSCDPTETRPIGPASLQSPFNSAAVALGLKFGVLTRALSNEGTRVFFDSPDALVAGDTNGVDDVYEWEAPGTPGGSCEVAEENGGCLYLLSAGTSPSPSYFGDASADGSNAFFLTQQGLVRQDRDELFDMYDARVKGGIASQNEAEPPICKAEECPSPPGGSPSSPAVGSTAAQSGNPPRKHCKKGFRRVTKHGKEQCVKVKKNKKKAKKNHAAKKRRGHGKAGKK